MRARVGWYVHHHGAGHRTRARVVGKRLRGRGASVTLLGSQLGEVTPGLGRVDLARDDDGTIGAAADASVGGALHWAPLRHSGLRSRMAAISAWVERERPDVLVADVSVEVTLLARLHGVPVVLVAQPGDRDDAVHRLALDAASAVLAPWPAAARPAPYLDRHPRVRCVGGISGLTGRDVRARGGEAVLLTGGLGLDRPSGVADAIRAATPDLAWTAVGGPRWVPPDELAGLLRHAPVVVAHAGQNAVADLAATGAPAVLVPQERPFAEQSHLAAELGRLGLARVAPFGRQAGSIDWAAEVAAARGDEDAAGRWARWQVDGAADRAADLVLEVATEGRDRG